MVACDEHGEDGHRLLSYTDEDAAVVEELQHANASQTNTRGNHHRLYVSHSLSTWNSRVFEFGAYFFLAAIFPGTLLPASVYALARATSAALLSPWLGSYMDRTDRLVAVRLSIIGQRVSVALSCIVLAVLLYYPSISHSPLGTAISLVMLSALACVEKLSAVLNTISVERDWVVVIADGEQQKLAILNTQMRRIDLFCKLVGPLAVSLVDSWSTRGAIIATGLMSSLSSLVEYFAIAGVYNDTSALRDPKSLPERTDSQIPVGLSQRFKGSCALVSTYVHHPAFLPSLSLALLYLTVLSFSGQLITYLLARGLSSASIAVLRAIAAIFEMSATWLGPKVAFHIGSIRAGIWFLNAELLFIGAACGILWLPVGYSHALLATIGLVIAIILSRTGLWGFDLSAQLIIQDEVEPELRGTFSSLEFSLQNVFEMFAFASTIVFAKPEDFRYPALISAAAVSTAAILYACFVRSRRGHLIHPCKCLDRHHRNKRQQRLWQQLAQNQINGETIGSSESANERCTVHMQLSTPIQND